MSESAAATGLGRRDHPLRTRWRQWRKRRKGQAASPVIAAALRRYLWACVYSTRWNIRMSEEAKAVIRGSDPFLFAAWHCHGMIGVALMRHLGMRQPAAFMISDHRDGQLMARVQQGFGGVSVHGSTGQRGAVRALREAVRRISEEKRAFGITPDGPRGPSLTLNPGLAWIAAQTAVPVIGFAWMGRRTRILPSWDAYRWPRLFDRGHIKVVGPFLVSPRDLSQRRQFTEAFTEDLRAATLDVDTYCGRPSPSAGQCG